MTQSILDYIERPNGQSGQVAYVENLNDIILMQPSINLACNKSYCFSCWIKGLQIEPKRISIISGSIDHVSDSIEPLTWKRVVLTFVSDGNPLCFLLDSGEYQLYQAQLEEGTVPTMWKQSGDDNTSEMDYLIDILETKTNSFVQQTSDSIMQTIEQNYYMKSDTDILIENLRTQMEQDATSFNFLFESLKQNVDDIKDDTDSRFEEQLKYIRFEDGNIILGEAGNELVLKIQHDKISFIQNNNEVAYFSDNKLHFENGAIDVQYNALTGGAKLQLGKYAFIPRASGNLSFKAIG